ncbi:uncharacterized protein METZ01_LOCUS212220 [marine metagenome]|uniref:Uncharacterized protein n=1 Tax=marine metagenome TaxID=408172 RepID=A0A382F8J5_9ZZZZ
MRIHLKCSSADLIAMATVDDNRWHEFDLTLITPYNWRQKLNF